MEQSDINLDNFIRSRVQRAQTTGSVEPSADFTARTMARIRDARHHRRFRYDVYAAGISLLPIALHQAWWYLARGRDYFTVSRWPMGEYVSGAYQLFLSSLGLGILFAAGAAFFASYVFKFRRLRQSFVKTA